MSDENTGNVEKLIGEIRQLAVPDISRTGTIALINLVPYAGGSIATVMAEFQSKTKVEKICDALALLDRKVKESGTKVEDILDQEQVVELIHETLEKIALSSEEKHITYLKNALVSSFTNESIPYEQKKLYMSIVRALTGIEIKLLETFYEMVDPFVIDVPKERPQLTPRDSFGISTEVPLLTIATMWDYDTRFEDKPDLDPLITRFTARTEIPESLIPGVAGSLDGKGLSLLVPNLYSRRCKIRTPRDSSKALGYLNRQISEDGATPVEKSRTKFGEEFLRFVRDF